MPACSRWSSEATSDTTGKRTKYNRTPEGCQPPASLISRSRKADQQQFGRTPVLCRIDDPKSQTSSAYRKSEALPPPSAHSRLTSSSIQAILAGAMQMSRVTAGVTPRNAAICDQVSSQFIGLHRAGTGCTPVACVLHSCRLSLAPNAATLVIS